MAVRTFLEAIRETLGEEMRRDPSIIVLGEDVGVKGGVFLATDGLYAEFGEKRVIDTPLTESMIVGTSIGAAANGLRPVAEIQFADFIFPAFNQIVSEAGRSMASFIAADEAKLAIWRSQVADVRSSLAQRQATGQAKVSAIMQIIEKTAMIENMLAASMSPSMAASLDWSRALQSRSIVP